MTTLKDNIAIEDFLIGRKLEDGSSDAQSFREFIEKPKWSNELVKGWLDECIKRGSGAHDPYNRAFQDLVVSVGRRLGFEVTYGRYAGKSGEDNYDGIWRTAEGDTIVVEVKTTTWPISSINQLGRYLEELSKRENIKNIYGLYVIGKGDTQVLIELILGSKYKDQMRLIVYTDLMEILNLKQKLMKSFKEREAIEKVQNLLLPVESINIGNIVRLILDITTAKETLSKEENVGTVNELPTDQQWTKEELLSFLRGLTYKMETGLSAIAHFDTLTHEKEIIKLMPKIAGKRRPNWTSGINWARNLKSLDGIRDSCTSRCRKKKKELLLEQKPSTVLVGDRKWANEYKIKDRYRSIVVDWAKSEGLWIKE